MDSLTSSLIRLQTNHKLQQTSSSNESSELTCPFQLVDGSTDLDQTTTANMKNKDLNTMIQTKIVNSMKTNTLEPNRSDQKIQNYTQPKIETKGASQNSPNQQLWGSQTQSETLTAENLCQLTKWVEN